MIEDFFCYVLTCLMEEMPAKSWLSSFLCLKTDDAEYAYVYVYNPERDSVWKTVMFSRMENPSFKGDYGGLNNHESTF